MKHNHKRAPKARNPMVPMVRTKSSGAHGKTVKAKRKLDKQTFHRELREHYASEQESVRFHDVPRSMEPLHADFMDR